MKNENQKNQQKQQNQNNQQKNQNDCPGQQSKVK